MGKWMQRVQSTATWAGEAANQHQGATGRQDGEPLAGERLSRRQDNDDLAHPREQTVFGSTSTDQTTKRPKSPPGSATRQSRIYHVGDLVHRRCGRRRMTTEPVQVTEVLWMDGRVRYATSDSCLCPPEWLESVARPVEGGHDVR